MPSTESVLVGMFAAGAWVGVRTATYTFACGGRSYQPRKLYDNDNDPYQLVNLVDDPGYAPIRNALYAETVAWLDYAGWPWV